MSPVDFMGNNFNKTNYFEKNFKVCSKTLKFISSIINKLIIENALVSTDYVSFMDWVT